MSAAISVQRLREGGQACGEQESHYAKLANFTKLRGKVQLSTADKQNRFPKNAYGQ